MPQSEHTPGPWYVADNGEIIGERHGSICMVLLDTSGEANARLIAAAPELYEALVDALAGLHYIRRHYHDERTAGGDLCGVDFDRVESKARAAFAKARGETP